MTNARASLEKLEVVEQPPVHLDAGDLCYYAREYISGGGYQSSTTNNLISNFKKPPRFRGTAQWPYKQQAIHQFASELAAGFAQNLSVAAIPSSKIRSDPAYDSRLEDTLDLLHQMRSDLTIERPFECRETIVAAHLGGSRSIGELADNLRWRGLSRPSSVLVLIDDVLTSGAHYKACVRKALENEPNLKMAGFFWARTIWPADPTGGMTPLPS